MSRQSAYGTVVASTTVSAVLALCMIGLGATAPAAASSVTSSTTATGDEVATPVDIAAAIGASLDAGTQAGARTGGGFTRSFAGSALAASSTDSTAAAGAADLTSVLSVLSTNSAFAAAASAQPSTPTATSFTTAMTDSASFTVPSVDLPSVNLPSVNVPTVAAVAASTISAVAPVAASVHASVVAAAPALPVGSTRQVTQSLAANAGWSGAQWTCLSDLWQRESLFRTTARNYRSGAYGIPQALPASKMATAGADWRTNPATQVRWGLQYIASRYGNPCNAWAHWKRYRSY
jgi:hypothetical protein